MGKLWTLLRQINFGLDIFIIFFLLFEHRIVIPEIVQVPGRAHPLILHFPIVLLVILPFLSVLFNFLKSTKELQNQFLKNYVSLTHVFCALTVLFGLILSQEEGYGGSTVFWHKWTGVAVWVGILFIEYALLRTNNNIKFLNYGSIVTLAILVFAGHFGATLTHGEGFLTEPIQQKVEKTPLVEAELFAHIIFPVLEDKCISCHNPNKSKGDLILSDSSNILAGGENGAIINRDDPIQSLLLENILLDINHDDHMPPKGKPQLTPIEIELIKSWVGYGAPFNLQVSELEENDSLFLLSKAVYSEEKEPTYQFKPASDRTIQKLNDNYRLLEPLASKSPALYGRFLSRNQFEESQLAELQAVSDQLVDLNLHNLELTASGMEYLKAFKNLQVLNLNNTGITDESLAPLYELNELFVLSLIGTKVSYEGVSELLEKNPIRKIYVWNTNISDIEHNDLQEKFPALQIIGKSDEFGIEPIALNAPSLEPEEGFFKDSIRLTASHVINGVQIRYTEDESLPDSLSSYLYERPILFSDDKQFTFKAYKEGWLGSGPVKASYYKSKYTPDSVKLVTKPNEKYTGTGGDGLVDLKKGPDDFQDRAYLGYRKNEMEVDFYFGSTIKLSEILVSGIIRTDSYIFPAKEIQVFVTQNGKDFSQLLTHTPEQPEKRKFQKSIEAIEIPGQDLKGVKLKFKSVNPIPAWHRGKGDKAWIFVDEVLFR